MLRNKLATVLSIILLVQTILGGITVQAATIGSQTLDSEGACVMDYDTGKILYEYNGSVLRIPASMTKVMNIYCVYEALENGEISLDTIVPISENVYEKSRNRLYQSVVPLNSDVQYTVDELMDIVVVRSASGAAVALAELLDGSEETFVQRMNAKAEEMGIDAYYYDSCGIADNKISPIAMATLARNIIKDYPDILARSAKPSVDFHGTEYKTTNHLLDTYYYEGADGLKTGSTKAAKYCLCATAVRNGKRIISVTMTAPTVQQSFTDSAKLLDYGFSVAPKYDSIAYTDKSTFINGYEISTLSIRKGGEEQPLVFARDLSGYGFDVVYDVINRTTTIKFNKDKKFTPISSQPYKEKNGESAFTVIPDSNIQVYLDDGAELHQLKQVYNAEGHIYIATNELEKIYTSLIGDDGKSTHIQAVYKEPSAVLPDGEKLTSKSAYIMDYDTGHELYSFDCDSQRPAASIAKMMSVYIILDAIENGEISLDTVVPISENVYNLSRLENYKMMVNLEQDEKYTVNEMLDMIVIDSAAACVTAVAELLCGNESNFVERMNKKAKEIGINAVFYNGTGVCLNPEADKENLMSAKDIAIMARCMIEDYPEILERTKKPSIEFHGKTYYNLNKILSDYYYQGADGFKNGMTEASGYCMCGTAQLNGKRIITVTLPSDSNETRFTDTVKMFNHGFRQLGIEPSTELNTSNEVQPIFIDNQSINVSIDGILLTLPEKQPVIIGNTIMLPVSVFSDPINKAVEWNTIDQHIKIIGDNITLNLTADSDIMVMETINPLTSKTTKEEIKLEKAPVILDDICYLPVSDVMEAFGSAVIYDAGENILHISVSVC